MPRSCRTPNVVLVAIVNVIAMLLGAERPDRRRTGAVGHWTSPPLRELPRGCRHAGVVGLMGLSATTRFAKARRLSALGGGLLVCALASAPSAFAASTPTVNLGQAASYAVISGASVANLGDTTVRGDIGAPTQPSGFPPGVLVGNMQVGSADATAYNDMLTAYAEVQARTGGTALPALTSATLTPGLYTARCRRRRPRVGRCDP